MPKMIESIKLFNNAKIRAKWDEEQEEWHFSIIDVIAVLTESENPGNYWKVLKHRLNNEGSQVVTNCNQLRNNYLIKKKKDVTVCHALDFFSKLSKKIRQLKN